MFTEMIETLKEKDKKEEFGLKIYNEGNYKNSFNNFAGFLIKYFNVDALTKRYDDCDRIISRTFLFYSQLEELNYLEYILEEIKDFIPLIFKISQNFWLVDKLKKSNLTEDSIIKILDNFVSLERTGRKRLFNKYDQEYFQKVKNKHQKISAFYEETETWDGKTKGSILDFAKTIKKYNISKKMFLETIGDLNYWIDHTKDWSKRTKYRFDKDIFKFEELKYFVGEMFKNYDFYIKCLKDHKDYIKSTH